MTPYEGMTPDDVAMARQYGQQLMQQGTSTAPVGHWTQALARALQGASGAGWMADASQGQRQGQGQANQLLAQALQGGDLKGITSTALGNPWTAPMGQQIAQSMISQRVRQSDPMYQAQLSHAKASEGRAAALHPLQVQQAQAGLSQAKSMAPEGRAALAKSIGLPETAPEYKQFVATGTWPTKTGGPLEGALAKTAVDMAEKDIQAGYGAQSVLDSVAKLRDLAKDPKFEGAVGPIAGNSMYQTVVGGMVPFSQTIGLANPALHRQIEQTKASLLLDMQQKMKGLGPMSDADARRVEQAVGNLNAARNKREYLNAVSEMERSVQSILARAQVAAKQYPALGSRLNVTGDQKLQGRLPQAQSETKSIGGKTYVKRDGQWYEQ